MAMDKIPVQELYIYGLSKRVLESLELIYFDSRTVAAASSPALTTESLHANDQKLVDQEIKDGTGVGCLTCKFTDADPGAVRQHYHSDFHRFNAKRRSNGLPPVDEDQFETIVEGLEESLSGSDNSEDDTEKLDTIFEASASQLAELDLDGSESSVGFMNTRSPLLLFSSPLLQADKCLGVFKAVFSSKALQSNPLDELKAWNSVAQSEKYSALFMIGGGHFAGAIISHKPKSIKGNVGHTSELLEQSVDIVEHKTFHRYTTRRKQGGSQSASDNARGKANSAGSSLRRYNEAALEKEVRELLQSWSKYLAGCESIFLRANGSSNRNILVGYAGSPLQADDGRIKSFPFTTKRATTSELKKAWINLTYATVEDMPKTNEKELLRQKKQQESLAKSTRTQEKQVRVKTEQEKHTEELVSAMKRSKAPAFISYVKKNKLGPDFNLQPAQQYQSTPTLLHYASANGLVHIAQVLLTNLKAKPDTYNSVGKTPYDVAASGAMRNVFRVARHKLGESFCDWEAAHVGEPKSKEEIEKEEADLKAQDETLKKNLIEQELAKYKQETAEEHDKKFGRGKNLGVITSVGNDLTQLSEEQKMRLMREQRARAAEARFKQMQN